MIKHVMLFRWFGDTHHIPWVPAGRAAVRQPVAFRCPCLCFLLHHMTVVFHHPWPLQIWGKSQNKQDKIHMTAAGNNQFCLPDRRGHGRCSNWSEAWKTGRLEHGALTMSFLDLQWRLPLPSILTMDMERCSQHTNVEVIHNKYLWGGEPQTCCLVTFTGF